MGGDGPSYFGIQELDRIDENGQFQRQTFANLLDTWFEPQFLGLTVLAWTWDALIQATVTLFLWG